MNKYISYFSSLKTARIMGVGAPHKAVLLLAIMDLVEAGVIDSARIELSERLESAFGHLWRRYVGDVPIFQPKVATPFWHLQGEPFYSLFYKNGSLVDRGEPNYSVGWLRANTYAMIDEPLLKLMQDETARAELRVLLISTYLKDLRSSM